MDTLTLPAYGSHDELSTRLEDRETVLFNSLLMPAEAGVYGARSVIISRDGSGGHWLRVCEGGDDRWMRWIDQRRLRMQFGRAYAQALAQAWIHRWEQTGWKLEWSLQLEEPQALAA